ncbi:MAG: methyltransferase domain-containing protein [Minisyncoccia bacterium]
MKINKKLKKEYPWGDRTPWWKRIKKVAECIPEGSTVIDLGGGMGHILRHIKKCKYYTSIDIKEWTDLTIVADFNKGEYPKVKKSDWIICQGTIEYMENPKEFLTKIKKYGSNMVITCREGKSTPGPKRNDLKIDDLFKLLKETGWNVTKWEFIQKLDEVLIICTTW